jgi:transcriptional regulator with XRE-family HTH domain
MRSESKTQPDAGIGDRLVAARRRLAWTREELAFKAGISWPAIAQIESGRRTHPRPATLSALASALGVTIDYLVRGAPGDAPMLEHVALVYGDDDEFAGSVTPFVTEGIERSEAVMVVTRPANVDLVRESMGPAERQVEFVDSASWYAAPAVTLAAYRDYASAKLESGASWVRVVGEPAWTGKTAAEARLWGRYESLINLAFASWPVTVLCPYDERSLQPKILRQAQATHPETLADGAPEPCPDYIHPDGFVLGSGA